MRFLQNSDYYKYIKQNVLEQVINNDYDLLIDVENASILEVSGYIGVRYDRAQVFAALNDYDSAISYVLDTRVKYVEPAYVSGTSYSITDRVAWTDGFIYEAIQATSGTQDPTDAAYWTQIQENGLLYYVIATSGTTAGVKPDLTPAEYTLGDTRNPLIVQILIDVILYKVLKRTNPRNIPQLRVDSYDEAKTMLDQINKGEIMAFDLPLRTDSAEYSNTIVTGSSTTTKTSTYY